MINRKTAIGALTAALLVTSLPASMLAQDDASVTPEGIDWSLTSAGGVDVPAEVGANLYMEDGEANGSTGCNSFSGTYTLDGESLTFDENFAVTQAFCEGVAGEVEQAYMAALPTVASWSIDGTVMSLADESGTEVLAFEEPAVAITETDIGSLIGELERLHVRINNTRQDVRQLNVDSLRERVAGNQAVLEEVSTRVRDRVVATEAVLEEVTARFINVRSRVRDLERRVAALEKAAGLEAVPQE